MPRRKTIAIGPKRDRISWTWLGTDMGNELSKYYEVEYFDYPFASSPPEADVVLAIKAPPPIEYIEQALRRGTRMI